MVAISVALVAAGCGSNPPAGSSPASGSPSSAGSGAAGSPAASPDARSTTIPTDQSAFLTSPEQGDVPPPEETPALAGNLTIGSSSKPVTATIGAAGGSVTGSGISIEFPAGALEADTTVAMVTSPITGLATVAAYGGAVTPLTPLYTVDTGKAEPISPATIDFAITMPASAPAGAVVMAFYHDTVTGMISPLTTVTADATHVVALAPHFSSVFAAVVDLARLPTTVDSGFRPGKDDWEFPNYGSYIAPNGHCEGQVVSELWYYTNQRKAAGASPLYGLYDNNGSFPTAPLWADDSDGYRFASSVQVTAKADFAAYRRAQDSGYEDPGRITYEALRTAIAMTGQPQLINIWDAARTSGHAILVYRVTPTRVYVADPNYPGRLRSILYDAATGTLAPYSSGDSAASISQRGATVYTRFSLIPVASRISDQMMAFKWGLFGQSKIGDGIFPGYELEVIVPGDAATPDSRVPLTDGFTTTEASILIAVTKLTDGSASQMQVYRGTDTSPSGEWSWKQTVELGKGENPIGLYIKGATDPKNPNSWEYVDFVRLTINPGGAPSPTPTAAAPQSEGGDLTVTDFTGPTAITNDPSATYTYSIKVKGGTPPYTFKWSARGSPLAEGTGTSGDTQTFTVMQVGKGGNGEGYFISVYINDSANQGARWKGTDGRSSGEFMYEITNTVPPKVIKYPEYPYVPGD